MCIVCVPGVHGDQTRALDLLELELMYGCEPLCVCLEPNHSLLQEQQVLFINRVIFQPHFILYSNSHMWLTATVFG